MNKWHLSIAVVVVLATLKLAQAKDLSPDKLKKSYAKINKYLDKNVVDSESNVEAYMEKVKQLLAEKSSSKLTTLVGGSSEIETIKLLVELSEVPSDSDHCDGRAKFNLLEKLDSGLSDATRLESENYFLTKVDKIINHYAFETTLHCEFVERPRLIHTYKQLAYDKIEKRLVDSDYVQKDAEKNMARAEELLERGQHGAMGEALQQIVSMKLLLSEETCNEEGYKILLRNELATKGNELRAWSVPERRVDQIYQYYAKKHDQLCKPIFLKIMKHHLMELDQDTYRRVLGLTSSFYLDVYDYNKLVKSLSQKEVDEDFSTPLMKRFVEQGLHIHRGSYPFKLPGIGMLDMGRLNQYYEALIDGAPDTNVIVQERYSKAVDGDKLRRLLNEYLFSPCNNFIESLGSLIEADNYGLKMREEQIKLEDDLTYHMLHRAYQACKVIGGSHGEEIYTFLRKKYYQLTFEIVRSK